MTAKIYRRVNGQFGASCGTTADTGYDITVRNNRFTVADWDGATIISDATKADAEAAIEADWTRPGR